MQSMCFHAFPMCEHAGRALPSCDCVVAVRVEGAPLPFVDGSAHRRGVGNFSHRELGTSVIAVTSPQRYARLHFLLSVGTSSRCSPTLASCIRRRATVSPRVGGAICPLRKAAEEAGYSTRRRGSLSSSNGARCQSADKRSVIPFRSMHRQASDLRFRGRAAGI